MGVAAQIAANAAPVTPSDTTVLANVIGLYVTGGGTVKVRPLGQEGLGSPVDVSFGTVAVGGTISLQVSRVLATGTSATVVALLSR
jgi:hypothetical protein